MNHETAAFLRELGQTQFLPRESFLEYQRRLLEKLLLHARAEVPFYAERLNAAFDRDGHLDLGLWESIPVFTRSEAQEAGVALYARNVPPNTRGWVEGQTSGSTGIPFRHRRSRLVDLANICVRQRDLDWFNLDFDADVAHICVMRGDDAAVPKERRRGVWNLRGVGRFVEFNVRASIAEQLDWLTRTRASFLMTFPSVVRALGEEARARSSALTFDAILTYGENLPPEVSQMARERFNAETIDGYGATEAGRMAAKCPLCNRYHVNAETVRVELIDECGAPVRPGEIGRIVVTSIYNYAMPLIRYDIGDLAEAAPAGECRRTLPSIARFVGRTRNVFILKDGSKVWPDTRAVEMQRYIGFAQVQVVQTELDRVEVRYVADGSGRAADDAGLENYFRKTIHPSLNVRAVPVDGIARSPSGKFEDYVSLVASEQGSPKG